MSYALENVIGDFLGSLDAAVSQECSGRLSFALYHYGNLMVGKLPQ